MVAGLSLTDGMRSSVNWEMLGARLLIVHVERKPEEEVQSSGEDGYWTRSIPGMSRNPDPGHAVEIIPPRWSGNASVFQSWRM